MRISDWSSDVCSSDLAGMQINQQPDRTFAILAIELGVQAATSGGDTPVDAARIVADCVRAHFFDFEAATTLGAAMAALNLRERRATLRSEEHPSELQSLMRISYAVFFLKKKQQIRHNANCSFLR